MEGSEGIGRLENGSSSEGRPPNPLMMAYREYLNNDRMVVPCKKSLVRHASLQVKTTMLEVSVEPVLGIENHETEFIPVIRSGAWSDIGLRKTMEDVLLCIDNFVRDGLNNLTEVHSAFYGVFDGHGGKHAADFACNNLPRFIIEGEEFPQKIERAVSSAFLQTDAAFAEACSLDAALASGTTALAALVLGRDVAL